MDATLEHNNEDHDEDEEEQGDDDDQPNEHKHSRTIQRIYRQEVVDMHSQSKASIATELITFEHCTCTGLRTLDQFCTTIDGPSQICRVSL